MPQALPAIAVAIKGAVGGALTAVGVGATTAFGIGSAVGSFATSGSFLFSVGASVLSALAAPQVDLGGAPDEWQSDLDAPLPFVIGRTGSGGYRVHRDSWGADNRYRSIVTVYSYGGQINAIEGWTANGEALTIGANGEVTAPSQYAGKMWIQSTTGASPQATALNQTGLAKSSPGIEGWGASAKISGAAHSFITFYQDSKFKSFPAGVPDVMATLRGRRIYSARLDSTYPGGSGSCRLDDPSTYVYSTNPYDHAVQFILGYYEDGKLVGGCGADISDIDMAAFIAGANVADANGWEISARPTTKDDKHEVIKAMLQAGGGRYIDIGGRYSCIVNAPGVSVATVTADDTAGEFVLSSNTSFENRLNTLTPRCPMESHRWQPIDQDPVTNAAWVTEDKGQESDARADYPYVAIQADGSNANQPAELAAYDILNSRETLRGMVPLKPYMRHIRPGDIFTINDPRFLLDNVELLCLRSDFDPLTGVVNVVFQSETAGKHDFALGRTNTPPTPPGLTAPDYYDVPPPAIGIWTATAGTGNQPTITVSGDADLENARGFIVEFRVQGDTDWQTYGEYDIATTSVALTGLEPNTAYELATRYVSQYGILGTRRVLGVVTTGAMVADDATGPSQRIAAAAGAVAAGQDQLDAALAAFRAQLDTLSGAGEASPDMVAALDGWASRLGQDVGEVLAAAELGSAQVAARVRRLEGPSDNLIQDAHARIGGHLRWRGSNGAPATIVPRLSGGNAYRDDVAADDAGAGPTLTYTPRHFFKAGETLEVSALAVLIGTATNARAALELFNTEDAVSPAGLIEIPLADGVRDGSITVEIAADTWARLDFRADKTAGGPAALEVEAPIWGPPEDGQASIRSAPPLSDPRLAFIEDIQAALADLVVQSRRLQAANDKARADYREILQIQVGDFSAIVEAQETLETSFGNLTSLVDTLQSAVSGVVTEAKRIDRLEVGVVQNKIPDPLFEGAAEDWETSGNPPETHEDGGRRFLHLSRLALGAGDLDYLRFTRKQGLRFRVHAGQVIEWSPRVRLSGVVSSAKLQAQFTDLSGAAIGEMVTGATATGAGWIENAPAFFVAPADGFIWPQVTPVASGAGEGAMDFDQPQLLGALEGQTTRTPFEWATHPQKTESLVARSATARQALALERQAVIQGETRAEVRREAKAGLDGRTLIAQNLSAVEIRTGQAEASIAALDAIAFDLQNNTYALSSGQALELRVTGAEGEIDIAQTDITAANLAIATLNAIAADAPNQYYALSSGQSLDLRLTGAEGDIGAVESQVQSQASSIVDLQNNSATTTQLNAVSQSVAGNSAAITSLNQIAADLQANAVTVTDFNALSLTVDGQSAELTTLGQIVNDQQVGLSLFYGASLDVNGFLAGWEFYNTGAVAPFKIRATSLEVDGLFPMEYDSQTGELFTDALIARRVAAQVIETGNIKAGNLGGERSAPTLSEFQFPKTWQMGMDRSLAANWRTLTRQSGFVAVPAGSLVKVRASYFVETWVGLHTLLTFRDKIEIMGVQDFGWITRLAPAGGNALNQNDYGTTEPRPFYFNQEETFVVPNAASLSARLTIEPHATQSNGICCHQLNLGVLNNVPGGPAFHEAVKIRRVNVSISFLPPGPNQI
jgi:hypothetical protein